MAGVPSGIYPAVLFSKLAKLILIADDDENDAILLRTGFRTVGIKNPSIIVSDGSSVISYFKGDYEYADRNKNPLPGILFLDLKMPRIGGLAVMEWLNERKELKENLLIIVLTGLNEMELMKRAYQLGAHFFLSKPCGAEDLRNLVRRYSAYWDIEEVRT